MSLSPSDASATPGSKQMRQCAIQRAGDQRAEGSNRWGGTPIDAVTGHDDVLLYVNILCVGVRIPSTAALHPLVGPVQA